jgi:hypothetical protein
MNVTSVFEAVAEKSVREEGAGGGRGWNRKANLTSTNMEFNYIAFSSMKQGNINIKHLETHYK